MKAAITGTTRGLGCSLSRHFQREMVFGEIVRIDRPDFDITKDQEKIVEISKGCEVFVNNAHSGYAQTELLYQLFEANRDRNCVLLNIGSVSADGDRKDVNPYAIQKKALDAACTQLQLVPSKCKVIQIKLGRMETDMVAHIDAPKMNLDFVSRSIVDVTRMCFGNAYVKTITIDIKQ